MSDVKEAAQRLRQAVECEEFATDIAELMATEVDPLMTQDLVAIAKAYLSEHAADDDEAITDKWWSQFTNGELSIATPISGTLTMNWGRLFLNSQCLIANPTRGQLRRLIAALGAS